MNPALIVAIGLALLINFSPRGECQQNPAQAQQRSANQLTVPSSQQHATRETATTHNDPPRWYKAPEWILVIVGEIRLCQSAMLERDPAKLERVARARSAVLDRIEDCHTKPLNGEQHDLRDALGTLDSLRRIAEREWRSVKG